MPVSFLGPARLRAASPSDAPEALSGLGRGALGRGEERRTQLRGGGAGGKAQMQRRPRGHLPTRQQSPGGAHREGDPGGRGCGRQDGSGRPPGGDGCWAVSRRKSRSPAQEQGQEGCRQRRQPRRLQKGHGQRALCPARQDRHKDSPVCPPSYSFLPETVAAHLPWAPRPHARAYRHRQGSDKALEGSSCSQARRQNRGGERQQPCGSGGGSGEGGLSPSWGANVYPAT